MRVDGLVGWFGKLLVTPVVEHRERKAHIQIHGADVRIARAKVDDERRNEPAHDHGIVRQILLSRFCRTFGLCLEVPVGKPLGGTGPNDGPKFRRAIPHRSKPLQET